MNNTLAFAEERILTIYTYSSSTLAQTHPTLTRLTATQSDATLDFHPQADAWSIREILAHLVDDEMYVMRTRLVRMLQEEMPLLIPHDEKKWYATRNTSRDHIGELLSDFATQRAASLGILHMLSKDDWERQGNQPEYGILTVAMWVDHWIEHDTTHIAQISETLEAYQRR